MKFCLLVVFIVLAAVSGAGGGGTGTGTVGDQGWGDGRRAVLTTSCDMDGVCFAAANGKRIETAFYHMGEGGPLIEPLSVSGGNLFLVQLYHGDGCPAMYALAYPGSGGEYSVSESFGNCNEVSETTAGERGVLFRFPEFAEAMREEAAYLYSFSKNTVIKVE